MSEDPEWANLTMAARKQFQFPIDFNPRAKLEVWACLCRAVEHGRGAELVALRCLHVPAGTPSQPGQVPFELLINHVTDMMLCLFYVS